MSGSISARCFVAAPVRFHAASSTETLILIFANLPLALFLPLSVVVCLCGSVETADRAEVVERLDHFPGRAVGSGALERDAQDASGVRVEPQACSCGPRA